MPSSDVQKKPLAVDFNEERLRIWKEKRARIAEASAQEKARQSDAEKQDRLRSAEKDKQRRLREAAAARAAEEAEKKSERLNAARIRLAGRADVDAARQRLVNYRRREARKLVTRFAMAVGLPTLAVAIYLFALATPLFEAKAKFALSSTGPETQQTGQALLSQPPGHQQASQVRAMILSPQMLAALDRDTDFTDHLSSENMDPIARMRALPWAQVSINDRYGQFVKVTVNSQEGILTLKTTARDGRTAELFATTILSRLEARLAGMDRPIGINLLSPPVADTIATYPRRLPGVALAFLAFATMFCMGSIFVATLRRHGQH